LKYFEKYFSDVSFPEGAEEVKVLCPFHNDTHPSATINIASSLFHCWACGAGYNEQQFIAKINNISMLEAGKVLAKVNNISAHDWFVVEKANFWANENFIKKVENLGLSRATMEEMHLGITTDALNQLYLGVPVFFDNVLMDVRSYNILKIKGAPKWQSQVGAQEGFIAPFDIWKKTPDKTYLLEGEKDMMIAREFGVNAITLTGGAGKIPNEFAINAFKDREIVICYDNDEAGMRGMTKMFASLKDICKSVKFLKIGEVCIGEKEDVWDFFMKYKKDVLDFYSLPEYDFPEEEVIKNYIQIKTALETNAIKKELISTITVSAEFDDSYAVPTSVDVVKKGPAKDGDTLMQGETKTWYLTKENSAQMLAMIEVQARKEDVSAKIKGYMGVPAKELGIEVHMKDYITVYKSRVTDSASDNNYTLDIYTFDPMTVGKQFEIKYRIFPHPTKNQKLVAIATTVKELDNQDDFKPNVDLLKKFQTSGTVEDRLDYLYKSAKHHIAKHLNYNMWLMSDLVFNSIYEFNYGELIRGALDVFVLGDTQVGKSETTLKLTELYRFGHFLSLKTSTTVGLIGGSTKVENNWANTVGAIPKQHRKLVVMEEFSGAQQDFIKKMTDIRSSGWLRLARAAGELRVPCRLRMITISNPVNDDNGNPRFLSNFPNGISPLMELIKSAEDVSRYDGFLLMSKPTNRINPFSLKLEGTPIEPVAYQHKINWAYTRKPSDVVFAEGVESYIWEKAQILNGAFECNFPLFGVTTSLKLARFSVALASLIMSTDPTYTQVVITKDIVDYIVKFFYSIYDNHVFKLREYKKEYDSYNHVSDAEMIEFQDLYSHNSTLFEFFSNQSSTSRMNLQMISGLDSSRFSPVFNRLIGGRWAKLSGETVFPTEKFRLGLARIGKQFVTQDRGQSLVHSRKDDDVK